MAPEKLRHLRMLSRLFISASSWTQRKMQCQGLSPGPHWSVLYPYFRAGCENGTITEEEMVTLSCQDDLRDAFCMLSVHWVAFLYCVHLIMFVLIGVDRDSPLPLIVRNDYAWCRHISAQTLSQRSHCSVMSLLQKKFGHEVYGVRRAVAGYPAVWTMLLWVLINRYGHEGCDSSKEARA